jgi:histone H1/5
MTETSAPTPSPKKTGSSAKNTARAAKSKTGKKKAKRAKKAGRKPARKTQKKAAKKTAKKTKNKRYSDKRRAELLAKYNALCSAGDTTKVAAEKVGVPYITLRSWEKKSGKPTGRKPSKARKQATKTQRPAKAPKPGKRTGMTLTTPTGFRVEGISAAELVRVIKDLR